VPLGRALVFSPFATVPQDAGQRKRAYQTTKLLKDLGFEITFILYAFEDGWKVGANEKWLRQMRQDWDEVIVWRANPKVGMPASPGPFHGIDEWWDETLDIQLRQVFAYRFYDVFVVHNVWLSKAFDFAPRGTVRILDTHDVFSSRRAYFERTKIAPEFFMTDEASEAQAVGRANIALAIQKNDEAWFGRQTKAMPICLPYDGGNSEMDVGGRREYRHRDKVVFGFLGSAHVFNVKGLAAYCKELKSVVGRTASPVELRIGGAVCDKIDKHGPWILCGKVADEEQFFADVDIAVAPVFDGSGFKIKVADTVARGLPILSSKHAAIGTNLGEGVLAETPDELAAMTANIALHRPSYQELRNISREAYLDLKVRTSRATLRLERRIANWPRAIAYDLTGLTDKEASAVLLSWSGAFHVMRFQAKQFIVVAEPLRNRLENLVLAGVFLVSEQEMAACAEQVWHWITVKNVNPQKWARQSAPTHIDEGWRRAIDDDADSSDGEIASLEADGSRFWHNVNWDLLVRNIVSDAGTRPSAFRSSLAETVYVFSGERGRKLDASLGALFSDSSVADIGKFEDFFELMMQIAAGKVRRLVVIDQGHRERTGILKDLCAARSVEYVGGLGKGGLSLGKVPKRLVQEQYQRFESRWRLVKDDAPVPATRARRIIGEFRLAPGRPAPPAVAG
jgi:Glycosyl transferases group 1